MATSKIAPSFLKKITPKECRLNPKELEKVASDSTPSEVPVLRVYGVASKTASKTSNLGPYVMFEGGFEAINLLTGTKYRSDKMILPGVAEQFAVKAVESAMKIYGDKPPQVGGIAGITIGLDLTVIENKTSYEAGWKFKYGVSPLSNIEGKDAIAELGESFGAPPLYLPDKSKKK